MARKLAELFRFHRAMSQFYEACGINDVSRGSVSCHDGDDHGVRRADTARAHAQWWLIVASHEATDMLHRAMCLAPYLPGGMVVAIAVESVTS